MWRVTIVVTLVPLTLEVVRGMAHGDFEVDIIALLAMAAALIGDELLAGAIVAFGYLPPVAGALLQEGIDVAAILNALRALRS